MTIPTDTMKYAIAVSVAKIEHAIASFVWNIGNTSCIVHVTILLTGCNDGLLFHGLRTRPNALP